MFGSGKGKGKEKSSKLEETEVDENDEPNKKESSKPVKNGIISDSEED